MPDDAYGAYYYSHDCGIPYERNEHWMSFFGAIAERIVRDLRPQTMLDAGCAMALLVEQLHDRGVDVRGIDISEYAISKAPESVRDRVQVGSLTAPIEGRYDLVISVEVLEHLEAKDCETALDNLCAVTDAFLFSSSPYDYGEPTHINVKTQEQWSEAFARRGFFRDNDHDASYLTDWATLYRRQPLQPADVAREYERVLWRTKVECRELRASVLAIQSRLERIASGEEPAVASSGTTIAQLELELVDARAALLAARDTIAGLEAQLGVALGERERYASHAASREHAVRELEAMRNSRAWRLVNKAMQPLRRLRG